MEKINRLSLYILNTIKFKRLVLGKSAYQLSLDIKKSEGYVTNMENQNTPNQYNSADYPLIAAELGCELSDLIPPDNWEVSDSHEKVDKVVVSLSDPAFVRRVLEGIKASPKADVLEDLDKLYKHLSTKDANEKAVIKKVWEGFGK
ncbi:hypothetical protein H8B06_02565 [Sphingobacterium sp. DN00404]|uniref:XRE family transcriptional regulator n=1 Tax=Sphingobacterium micropteri TaxID=2763501 RepID=A0ABR7YK51_9SPHI|nr:hypothetical protein [Sphingobacterium micropteri]MBD1431695.1 hypothetical protein [Sphingobacterium micropteri]